MTREEKYIKLALKEAQKAQFKDEVPIGCVIVKDDKVIARGHNLRETKNSVIKHAEIVAINRACKKLGQKFLNNCDIYVTLEPCAMCATAISLARIRNIYFAAFDSKGGGIYSNARVFDTDRHLWKPNVHQVPEYAVESADLLRKFFAVRRKK